MTSFLATANRSVCAVRLKSQTDAVQLQRLENPSLPSAPAAPNRPLLLALVLFAGIGAGIGSAFALGHLQTSFATASKLERASGIPVIGAISQMLTSAQRAERKRKMRLFYAASAGLFGAFVLMLLLEFIQRGLVA